MPVELTQLIPEFNEIRDAALRQKALAVWEEALATGGWTVDDLSRMPFTLLAEGVRVSFAEHVSTVARLCMAMDGVLREAYGEKFKGDRDTLIAGALLADVGKLIEFERKDGKYQFASMYQYLRHPFTGVGLCYKHGIPPEVMHVVATHSWEGDKFKRRPESIIFHHADFTDFDLERYK
ncbi:MAG: HDIG domain-containing metalloprotein [Anaerolineales bacterium]